MVEERHTDTIRVGDAINIRSQVEEYAANITVEGDIGYGVISFTSHQSEVYEGDTEITIGDLKITEQHQTYFPGHSSSKEFSFTEDFSVKKVDESIYNDEIAGTVDSIYTTLTLNGTANITNLEVSGNLTLGGNKIPTFYSGTDIPDDSIGALGDIYIRTLGDA